MLSKKEVNECTPLKAASSTAERVIQLYRLKSYFKLIIIQNSLTNRAYILSYPANEPCEDRFNCYQLKNINGSYAGVFDGHGGWQVSELAMRKLHVYLDEALKKAKSEKDIIDAIN